MSFFDAVPVSIATSFACRPIPVLEDDGVEPRLGGIDGEADVGGAAEANDVAVLVDQLSLATDPADRRGTTVGSAFTSWSRDWSNDGTSAPLILAHVEGGLPGSRPRPCRDRSW